MKKNKLRVAEQPEIIVSGTLEKPYYEVRYREVGAISYSIGFGSYSLANVYEWLEEEIDFDNESPVSDNDPVNHPSHYTQNKFESIDEMMIVFGPDVVYSFCICNAWKYKNRAPFKGKFKEDMQKADWYLTKAKSIKEGTLWQE